MDKLNPFKNLFAGSKPKSSEVTPPVATPVETEEQAYLRELALKMLKVPGTSLDKRTSEEIVKDNHQTIRDSHQGNGI